MNQLRYSVFTLGGLASFAAAAIGIAIYASHPGGNFYIIGWDELEHRPSPTYYCTAVPAASS